MRSSPILRAVPRAAAACPWGSALRMETASASDPWTTPPLITDRMASTNSGGIFERFAIVLLRILGPSLQASLRRIAGGEDLFGMTSTLMAILRFPTWQHHISHNMCISKSLSTPNIEIHGNNYPKTKSQTPSMRCAKSMSCKERRCQRTTELQSKAQNSKIIQKLWMRLWLNKYHLPSFNSVSEPNNSCD